MRRSSSLLRSALVCSSLLALGGCEGLVSNFTTGSGGGGNGSGGGNGGNGVSPGACQLARAPLTRLNTQDIDSTLATVLGDELKPARFFPADVIAPLHFDNDATQLAIAPRMIQDLEASAAAVIDAAWTRDAALRTAGGSPKLQTCAPGGGMTDSACARQILTGFARAAWRRPATDEELTSLVSVYDATRGDGDDFAASVKLALSAVVLSPNFLLRTEAVVPAGEAASSWAVASRLSYFLWGTSPDAELSAKADSGELTQTATLDAQIARLLADPRAAALKQRFVLQWFDVRNVEGVSLDAALFPGVTPEVMKSMGLQIRAYLEEFLFSDRDALDLVDAPVTYVDGTLSRFLGVPSSGEALSRVTLEPGHLRSGLLGQSGPLVVTSKSTKTNVPKRGNYVLERMLCSPLAPPAGVVVPPVPDATPDQPTVRARLDALTQDPACHGCHQLLNPLGYALERYAADSRYRTEENGANIDTSGAFVGKNFGTAPELAQIIKADARVESCMVDRTLTYALGRKLARDGDDATVTASLLSSFSGRQHRFQGLVAEAARATALACKP